MTALSCQTVARPAARLRSQLVPILQSAFLANAAQVDQSGLVSVLGAFVEVANAPQLPARHQLWLVARYALEEGDAGPAVPLALIVEHTDGERLLRIDATFPVSDTPPNRDPEIPVTVQLVLPFALEFRRQGLYHVRLLYNGEQILNLPLRVLQALPTI